MFLILDHYLFLLPVPWLWHIFLQLEQCWISHKMSENVEDFPLGPPPSYETTQKVNNNTDLEKKDIVNHFIEISDYFEFEDPPPYKEKESSRVCEDTSGFQFVFPLITRPWKRFFTVCLRGQCNLAPENFGQNMTYYQLNYSWILLIVVIVAVVV